MAELSSDRQIAVRYLIKRRGPVTAIDIAQGLGLSEKQARSAIDALRAAEEPVWHDPATGGFWWRDDRQPDDVAHNRWKRAHTAR